MERVPKRLYEVRPQDRDQRRTVEQIIDNTCSSLPSLDVPVPQMENQLVEGGVPAARCHSHSRAGYRSAQDLILFPSLSQAPCAFRAADGGTVGGSAYDRIFFFVAWAGGAER